MSTTQTFQPGDVVTLKSGGITLTVVATNKVESTCIYYNIVTGKIEKIDEISNEALVKLARPTGTAAPDNDLQDY